MSYDIIKVDDNYTGSKSCQFTSSCIIFMFSSPGSYPILCPKYSTYRLLRPLNKIPVAFVLLFTDFDVVSWLDWPVVVVVVVAVGVSPVDTALLVNCSSWTTVSSSGLVGSSASRTRR